MKPFFHAVLHHFHQFRYQLLITALLAPLLVWLTGGAHPLLVGASVGIAVSVIGAWRLSYLRSLDARIATLDWHSWEVRMNQVRVGRISDCEYAAIQRRRMTDPHLYLVQAMNVGRVLLNVFDRFYIAAPVALFWVMMALLMFSPSTITGMMTELHKASPAEIQAAALNAIMVMAALMVAVVPLLWMAGLYRFGFVNCFDEAIADDVRRFCDVAVEGDMVMIRQVGRVCHIHDLGRMHAGRS